MKRFALKAPAFVCAAIYLVLCWDYIAAMMAATTRNFSAFGVVQCLQGAMLFLAYGVFLSEKLPAIGSVIVGFLNIGIALLPYLLLALLLSPLILMTLPLEGWKNCMLPALLSIYPFAAAIWRSAARKR